MFQGRLHSNKKMLLRFSDIGLERLGVVEHEEFFLFIDSLTEKDELSTGQWKKLFAVLCSINEKTEMNYRIYENPLGVFFDVTTHTMGGEDILEEDNERPGPVRESIADKLKRYAFEVHQLDLKMDYLKKRRQEIVEKMKPLNDDVQALAKEVASIIGVVDNPAGSDWDLR